MNKVFAAALAVASAGCSLISPESGGIADNFCSLTADCGPSGVCVAGSCVASTADLSSLILQVDVPSTATFAQGGKFIDTGLALQGQNAAGFYTGYDIALGNLVAVEVSLATTMAECGGSAEAPASVPIHIKVDPAPGVVGLGLPIYSGDSGEDDARARVMVPGGRYDISVGHNVPELPEGEVPTCTLPPVLLPARDISGSTFPIAITVPAPDVLTGEISGLDLGGWRIALVDNTSGRLLSTEKTLQTQSADQPNAFTLEFYESVVRDEGLAALIRLSPPADQATGKPTVLWDLDAVDLDGNLEVGLSVASLAAAPKALKGQVLDASGTDPVSALITIQSIELGNGTFGSNAAFSTSVTADTDGNFDVTLLTGTYKVIAVPTADPSLAITEKTWTINETSLSTPEAIVIQTKASLKGTVLLPNGDPAGGITTAFQPATSEAQTYLETLNAASIEPNGIITTTDAAGAFAASADPGDYDLAVKPSEGSGYAWLARSRLNIVSSNTPGTAEFGTLTMSWPVVVIGSVLDPDGRSLSGALVRAWLTTDDAVETPTVIQIGEAFTDANGRYVLALPPSISQ